MLTLGTVFDITHDGYICMAEGEWFSADSLLDTNSDDYMEFCALLGGPDLSLPWPGDDVAESFGYRVVTAISPDEQFLTAVVMFDLREDDYIKALGGY